MFGDASGADGIVFRLIGMSFIASGLVAWQRRPGNRVGVLMVVTGFGVLVHPLLIQIEWSPVQTLAQVMTDWWSLVFVVLLLVFPQGGRLRGRLDWLLVVAFAIPLVVLQPVWLLFVEQEGLVNDLLVWPDAGIADAVDTAQRSILLAATLSLFVTLVWRWLQATAPLRRVLLPTLAGGATMLSFAGMLAADLMSGTRSHTLLLITLCVNATVPLAFLAGLLRSRLARVAVGGLLVELRDTVSPSALRDALAASLGDPSLTLLYWLPEYGSWADADGRPAALPADGGGRATKLVERGDERVAALIHDASLLDEPELVESACAVAAIALENARLHADLKARLDELRASRARIVETGDIERRRLERNLHDGAQQRLVALALSLGMAESRVRADPELVERLLAEAKQELTLGLGELRELARGIHPGVLSDHGLEVALESLAARAPVRVDLDVGLPNRPPEPVEVAAYFFVSESLANVAKYAQASHATVRIARENGHLLVEVADDGIGGADDTRGSGIRGLADRVETLGGRLRVLSPAGGGTRISAEIPCP
jgi:signal transduction histidine kinase